MSEKQSAEILLNAFNKILSITSGGELLLKYCHEIVILSAMINKHQREILISLCQGHDIIINTMIIKDLLVIIF